MNKQKALELFEAWWDSYDLHEATRIAQIDNKWPAVILDEGDNDWQQGLYVGWMNAMKARADLAAEQVRELVEAAKALKPNLASGKMEVCLWRDEGWNDLQKLLAKHKDKSKDN